MRILLLTLYFAPDVGANAVLMTGIAQELAALGHQVTVVTSVPHYGSNLAPGRQQRRLLQREQHGEVEVIRTYVYASPQKHRIAVRLLNYLSFNLLSTLAGLLSRDQDVILAPSPPLTIGLSAFLVGRLKGIPYVYNVQDIYPDVAIRLGALRNPWVIRFSRWMERFVYAHAAKVTVLSQSFKANLLAKGVPPDKVAVIPNFADVDFLRPMPRDNEFRRRFDLDDRFVVLYAGNVGHSQKLEQVLECAAMLGGHRDILFLIVGNGARKGYLEGLARDMSLPNVRFLPFLPWQDVPQMYAASDLCVITLQRGIANESVPSKAFSIMAGARPIVAAVDPGSDIWNVVQQAGCGLCVEPENPADLAGAITTLYTDPTLCRRLGENGRRHVVEHYAPRVVSSQYHDLLSSVRGRAGESPPTKVVRGA